MEHPLKCYVCQHKDVCKLLTPDTCQQYLPKSDPTSINRQIDRKLYRANLLKLATGLKTTNANLAVIVSKLNQDLATLEQHQYDTGKLQKIVKAIQVVRKHLGEETKIIEYKSKFPPQ